MKKNCFFLTIFFFFSGLIFLTSSCKKEATKEPTTYFSFMYNGKLYTFGEHNVGPYGGALGPEQEWVAGEEGIWINRPDIFTGIISFRGSNCTFFTPVSTDLYNLFNCQLSPNNNPVDSVAVYFYKSGINSVNYQNCVTKSIYDIVSGSYYNQTVCDAMGTFNLELMNKENKTIRLTDGKYKYKMIR